MRFQETGIKVTSAVSKGILLRMSHRSSVYNKLLRNQRIFDIIPLHILILFYIPSKVANRIRSAPIAAFRLSPPDYLFKI